MALQSDAQGLHSSAVRRNESLEQVTVKMSCFGFGKKKAKPILLERKDTANALSGDFLPSRFQYPEHTAKQSETEVGSEEADLRCGDASPRTWGWGDTARQPFHTDAQLQPPVIPDHTSSDDEGALASSGRDDLDNSHLAMHDSTSSLKEGIPCKLKAELFTGYTAQKETFDEEDDEDSDPLLLPEWEINPHDIFFCSRSNGKLCRLGKGAFGTVYKGVWKDQPVAVKVCRQQHVSIKAMKQFQKEVSILQCCSHSSIVQFKGACCWKGGKRTVLVTEFMEKGDLCTALGRSPGRYSWNHHGRSIALDVARGLAHLHASNIVHFDLKSANILLDRDHKAKLADVGLAKTLTNYYGSDQLATFMATGDLGTFAWAAPEVLLGFPCDAKADIFSFGVVMWELATTEMPQGRCLRPVRVPEEASEPVASLIMDCLRHDPAARPTAEQLVDIISRLG